jgi:hypothetical protein
MSTQYEITKEDYDLLEDLIFRAYGLELIDYRQQAQLINLKLKMMEIQRERDYWLDFMEDQRKERCIYT